MQEQFLRAALYEAWLGRGFCAPNPSVGAVAVHNGRVVAAAHHKGAGTLHAEALLLQKIPQNLQDLEIYVTLEPCNHWGKTPPCVQSLISYKGIKKVVYAYTDPNPTVKAHESPKHLREAGIEVMYHPLPEINEFYRSYEYWVTNKKPWVTVKIAQSLDGKIASTKNNIWLTNEQCTQWTHEQRQYSDILLTSAHTVLADNPAFNVRRFQEIIAKPVGIIDSSGKLTDNFQIFHNTKHGHLYYKDIPSEISLSNWNAHKISYDNDGFVLEEIISHLGHLGYHDVWIEVGAKLFQALHEKRLVNKTYIYIAPIVLGEDAISLYKDSNLLKDASKIAWKVLGNNIISIVEW